MAGERGAALTAGIPILPYALTSQVSDLQQHGGREADSLRYEWA